MGQAKYEALEVHNLTTRGLCSQKVRPPASCSQSAGKGADAKAALSFFAGSLCGLSAGYTSRCHCGGSQLTSSDHLLDEFGTLPLASLPCTV